MARPLREQFALATFLLLAPVGAVMTFAAGAAYKAQLDLVYAEASAFARTVAAHIDVTGPAGDVALAAFLERLPLQPGSRVMVADAEGKTIVKHSFSSQQVLDEVTYGASASVRGRPWTVSVGIPTSVAWERAGPNSRRTTVISGMATLILLVFQVVFLRRWLPALASLERSVAQVGAGDLRVLVSVPMPSRELEHLRDAFHDMVDKLGSAREAIARQVEEERRMRHELESLQQQVIRQERLAAIGVLASGIAHELNNPLQAISGFAELLQRDPRTSDQMRADLALIHQESVRASAIIRNLSRFGRQQGSMPVPVLLTEVLTSVVELRQRRLAEQSIRLERDEQATQPAHAVFTELQQVVLNFVINAEHSLRACDPANRRIVLRTRDDAGGVRLEVEDSGPGVSPEDETKLFQPFFTTKPVGEGTGLGLSVSYGIIRLLGGAIGYRRGELGGGLFFFTVPSSGGSDR